MIDEHAFRRDELLDRVSINPIAVSLETATLVHSLGAKRLLPENF